MTDNNDKIQGIMQSNSLDELPLKFLPPVSDTPDNYYFISYSHLDYKQVYSDIFALQSQGINVWYDRGMPAGVSWKETAEKYIRPSRCAGVVFYVSENSLLSPAIHEEIAFAKKCGKSCLTVNIPLGDNAARSAKEMLDEIIAQGKQISDEKYAFICETFGQDVLYVPYSAEADVKAEKIRSLKKDSSFEYIVDDQAARLFKSNEIILTSVKDIDIAEVKREDYTRNAFVNNAAVSEESIVRFDTCAFANCRRLKNVELPYRLEEISEYAFCRCQSLESVTIPSTLHYIQSWAFYDCRSLQTIVLSDGTINIASHCFDNCLNLQRVTLPKSVCYISEDAFAYCQNLKNICLPKKLAEISTMAFYGCKSLESVEIPDSVTELSRAAFASCEGLTTVKLPRYLRSISQDLFSDCISLRSIRLPNNVQEICDGAFYRCENLTSISIGDNVEGIGDFAFAECGKSETVKLRFRGTKEQWNNIDKDFYWNHNSGIVRVICKDGIIKL